MARLLRGMADHDCWLITLTRERCLDLQLRPFAWHRVLTRLRQRWPDVQAATVYEFSPARGVHLHIVMRGSPRLDQRWMDHVVALLGNGTEYDMRPVEPNRRERLAAYLTKLFVDPRGDSGWPRGFRRVSFTRDWCSDWQPRRRRRTQICL